MKFELVGEARIVFWRSSSSLLAIGATAFGAIGAMGSHINLVQPMMGPKMFAFVAFLTDAAPQIALGLTAAIPFARIVKQNRLRELTGAANPPPPPPPPPAP